MNPAAPPIAPLAAASGSTATAPVPPVAPVVGEAPPPPYEETQEPPKKQVSQEHKDWLMKYHWPKYYAACETRPVKKGFKADFTEKYVLKPFIRKFHLQNENREQWFKASVIGDCI
ncbi:hypothetical protein MPER_02317 [Moniliophthora perniciosa FA553]|nr:hypothetical protein MPER_02317 [Moniliophthora perniciosa FA553]